MLLACSLAALYGLFVWWFATGAILYLDGLPKRTFPASMLGMSVLAGAGLFAVYEARFDAGAVGAYHAFTGALAVWAWNEMAFLTGWITGPRRIPASANARGFKRALQATSMIIWHELAILVGFCALWVAASGGENRLALYSYGLLWAMRLSSKLNIFLGVPNAPVSFLPERLRHLASCFTERPMNVLFPIAVTIATAGLALLVQRATGAASEGEAIAYTLLSVFMALAILEHWFLVLPWQSEKLWKWGMRSHIARLPVEAPLAGVALSSYADARTKGSL